jgi:hypothetical protein
MGVPAFSAQQSRLTPRRLQEAANDQKSLSQNYRPKQRPSGGLRTEGDTELVEHLLTALRSFLLVE